MLSSQSLSAIDVGAREARLWAACNELGIEQMYIEELPHIRWLTGFTGSAGALFVNARRREVHLMTDSRYRDQSATEIESAKSSAIVAMARTIDERCEYVGRVSSKGAIDVDGSEMSVDTHKRLSSVATVRVFDGQSPLRELRRVKDDHEIARMRTAAAIADEALQNVVADGLCGLTEREVKFRLESEMARRGADAPSFETIVAAGPNAAMPHHHPTSFVVEPNSVVIIDMGALVDGYHSDMTRTVMVGEVSDHDSALFSLVRESQTGGVRAVRDGACASDVDAACRSVFITAGVDDLYTHGTGHGVGLDIHEEPFFHRSSDKVLAANEVVTVEPGLYRVGVSGVRIEDLVVVTDSGCEILTNTPKELSCPPSPRTI